MLCAGGAKKTISEGGDLREAVEKVMLGEKSNRTLGGKNWNGWHIMKWATR